MTSRLHTPQNSQHDSSEWNIPWLSEEAIFVAGAADGRDQTLGQQELQPRVVADRVG
jgi:hypothetical protein